MKTKNTILLLLSFLLLTSGTYFRSQPEFSYKIYGNVVSYFENEKDLQTFFEFSKGDVVAEIGTYDGQNIAGLSLLSDDITFYAQDINNKSLNQKNFDKLIAKAAKIKKPLTSKFNLCIGTEKSTNLPDGIFDKILLVATFHEFTFMDEMLSDISKKLKPNGKLYILESQCLSKDHKNYTADETITILKRNKFRLIKKDGKDLNGSSGLYRVIFTKE